MKKLVVFFPRTGCNGPEKHRERPNRNPMTHEIDSLLIFPSVQESILLRLISTGSDVVFLSPFCGAKLAFFPSAARVEREGCKGDLSTAVAAVVRRTSARRTAMFSVSLHRVRGIARDSGVMCDRRFGFGGGNSPRV